MSLNNYIVLLFLVLQSFAIYVYQETKEKLLVNSEMNLKFINNTGAGVTQDMIQTFVDAANQASFYFGSDIDRNIRYIKYKMDFLYGKANDNFYVNIQT